MIIVQRKVGKIRNNLVGHALSLVAKHYTTLKYTKENEEQPIGHLQHPKKTRKKTLQVPSIPTWGINLMAFLSQQEFPLVQKETMKDEEPPLGTKVV
jgi:hypothetical protein